MRCWCFGALLKIWASSERQPAKRFLYKRCAVRFALHSLIKQTQFAELSLLNDPPALAWLLIKRECSANYNSLLSGSPGKEVDCVCSIFIYHIKVWSSPCVCVHTRTGTHITPAVPVWRKSTQTHDAIGGLWVRCSHISPCGMCVRLLGLPFVTCWYFLSHICYARLCIRRIVFSMLKFSFFVFLPLNKFQYDSNNGFNNDELNVLT